MKKVLQISFALVLGVMAFFNSNSVSANVVGNQTHLPHGELTSFDSNSASANVVGNQTHLPHGELTSKALVEPRYIPCPGGGKHTMKARGHGKVKNTSGKVLLTGVTSQCSKCGDVIISENNPFYSFTTFLGKYGYSNSSYELAYVTYMTTNKLYYNSSLVNDPFFDSFIF